MIKLILDWRIYFRLEKYSEAIEECKNAIKYQPSIAIYHYNLGNLYSNLERYEDSIEPLKISIKLDPSNSTYYSKLALLYEEI